MKLTASVVCDLRDHISKDPEGPFANIAGEVRSLAATPHGKLILAGCGDAVVRVFEADTGVLVRTMSGHEHAVVDVLMVEDGRVAFSMDYMGTIKRWDTQTGACLTTFERLAESELGQSELSVSADGRWLAYSLKKEVKVLEWESDAVTFELSMDDNVTALAFAPDASLLLVGDMEGAIHHYDLSRGKLVRRMKGQDGRTRVISVSPDGRWCVNNTLEDDAALVWDLTSGNCVGKLTGHDGNVNAIQFLDDSRCVLTASADGMLRVFDTWTAQTLAEWEGHGNAIMGLAVADEGRIIASGSNDKSVRVWPLPDLEVESVEAPNRDVLDEVYEPRPRPTIAPSRSEDESIGRWRKSLQVAGISATEIGRVEGLDDLDLLHVVVPGDQALDARRALRSVSEQAGYWPVIVGGKTAFESLWEHIREMHAHFNETDEDAPQKTMRERATQWIQESDALPFQQFLNNQRDIEWLKADWLRQAQEWDERGADFMAKIFRDRVNELKKEDVVFDPAKHGWPEEEETPLTSPAALKEWSLEVRGEPYKQVVILGIPAANVWEVPAYLFFGGFNACPSAEHHVAMAKWAYERFAAEVIAMRIDTIEFECNRPPSNRESAMQLAGDLKVYAEEVSVETPTLGVLASALLQGSLWSCWWD